MFHCREVPLQGKAPFGSSSIDKPGIKQKQTFDSRSGHNTFLCMFPNFSGGKDTLKMHNFCPKYFI